jgi:hypothetical protein
MFYIVMIAMSDADMKTRRSEAINIWFSTACIIFARGSDIDDINGTSDYMIRHKTTHTISGEPLTYQYDTSQKCPRNVIFLGINRQHFSASLLPTE